MAWRGRTMTPVRVARDAPLLRREPVASVAALQTVLAAVLTALSAFGVWSPTDVQLAAVWGLWAAVTPLLAVWARGRVIPGTLEAQPDEFQ
jgi:hypothetical protein